MQLARELGLVDYPNPASGCLLTDPGYSARLRDLLAHSEIVDTSDLNLLRTGRQFRLSPQAKVIIGRHEADNQRIESQARPDDLLLEVPDTGSPVALLRGSAESDDVRRAAELVARYSRARALPLVTVEIRRGGTASRLAVVPASEGLCDRLRIASDPSQATLAHASD
jgi:hypothetical protein